MFAKLLGVFLFFSNIKMYLIIGLLTLVLGAGGMFMFGSKIHSMLEIHSLKKNANTSAKNLEQSHTKSRAIDRKIQKGNSNADRIAAAAANRLTKQKERTNAPQIDSSVPVADYRLDVGTVRLLNAARQGTPVESTGGSDAALAAPSTVGVDKLVANDLEVVKRYRDLAARHDSLVDFVEQKQREQTGGLGQYLHFGQ